MRSLAILELHCGSRERCICSFRTNVDAFILPRYFFSFSLSSLIRLRLFDRVVLCQSLLTRCSLSLSRVLVHTVTIDCAHRYRSFIQLVSFSSSLTLSVKCAPAAVHRLLFPAQYLHRLGITDTNSTNIIPRPVPFIHHSMSQWINHAFYPFDPPLDTCIFLLFSVCLIQRSTRMNAAAADNNISSISFFVCVRERRAQAKRQNERKISKTKGHLEHFTRTRVIASLCPSESVVSVVFFLPFAWLNTLLQCVHRFLFLSFSFVCVSLLLSPLQWSVRHSKWQISLFNSDTILQLNKWRDAEAE